VDCKSLHIRRFSLSAMGVPLVPEMLISQGRQCFRNAVNLKQGGTAK